MVTQLQSNILKIHFSFTLRKNNFLHYRANVLPTSEKGFKFCVRAELSQEIMHVYVCMCLLQFFFLVKITMQMYIVTEIRKVASLHPSVAFKRF